MRAPIDVCEENVLIVYKEVRKLEKDYAELMERNDKNLMAIDMLTRFIEKSEIETEKLRDMLHKRNTDLLARVEMLEAEIVELKAEKSVLEKWCSKLEKRYLQQRVNTTEISTTDNNNPYRIGR